MYVYIYIYIESFSLFFKEFSLQHLWPVRHVTLWRQADRNASSPPCLPHSQGTREALKGSLGVI